ncbi:hypothetical protein KCP74_25190 [Salmonella enterica subsp. enterica]|nr:hypothetical protein KCP74_25190 [Salmonella enterica subsp. enterica]
MPSAAHRAAHLTESPIPHFCNSDRSISAAFSCWRGTVRWQAALMQRSAPRADPRHLRYQQADGLTRQYRARIAAVRKAVPPRTYRLIRISTLWCFQR